MGSCPSRASKRFYARLRPERSQLEQTDGRTRRSRKDRAMHSVAWVKINTQMTANMPFSVTDPVTIPKNAIPTTNLVSCMIMKSLSNGWYSVQLSRGQVHLSEQMVPLNRTLTLTPTLTLTFGMACDCGQVSLRTTEPGDTSEGTLSNTGKRPK